MGKDNNSQTVSIDGVEYLISEMTQKQRALLDHTVDLERKIASVDYQRQQLQVGRDAFFHMLKTAIDKKEEVKQ